MKPSLNFNDLVAGYRREGFEVVVRPGPNDLPDFARDFVVELVGRRGRGGVIASIKRNRDELEAAVDLPHYAGVIETQPGWRYDLAMLEGVGPMGRPPKDLADQSAAGIQTILSEAERVAELGLDRPAFVAVWPGFEAATRMRIRAGGERAGWNSDPGSLVTELYTTGYVDRPEFDRLDDLERLRTTLVHGFASPTNEARIAGAVPFLAAIARRLVRDSEAAAPPA